MDDQLCNDPFQISILKMVAKDCKVYVQSVEKFTFKYKQHILDSFQVMLLFKDVQAPLQLLQNEIPIRHLVVATLSYQSGKTVVTRSVALDHRQADLLKEIAKMDCLID